MSIVEDVGNVHAFPGIFSAAELKAITEIGDRERPRRAEVDYAPAEARKGAVCWASEPWLEARLRAITGDINERFYRFDLDKEWREPFQFAHYGIGDHFHWHTDMGPKTPAPRKLSMTLQLTDPRAYEGGDLQMQLGCYTCPMPREKGTLIVFPSWLPHRVTPVERGQRRSMVVWAHGPQFR